jgi:hypothetical protein
MLFPTFTQTRLHTTGRDICAHCWRASGRTNATGSFPKLCLLLLMDATRLKKSLPHISVALRAVPNPPDGHFAQPIETGVHSWNPSFIPYEHFSYERNEHFLWSPDCVVCDPATPRDAQAETTDRWDHITKDVPVLWFDHSPIHGTLQGVWQVALIKTGPVTPFTNEPLIGRFSRRTSWNTFA